MIRPISLLICLNGKSPAVKQVHGLRLNPQHRIIDLPLPFGKPTVHRNRTCSYPHYNCHILPRHQKVSDLRPGKNHCFGCNEDTQAFFPEAMMGLIGQIPLLPCFTNSCRYSASYLILQDKQVDKGQYPVLKPLSVISQAFCNCMISSGSLTERNLCIIGRNPVILVQGEFFLAILNETCIPGLHLNIGPEVPHWYSEKHAYSKSLKIEKSIQNPWSI